MGIAPRYLPFIFQRFGDPTNSVSTGRGSDCRLAIAQAIAQNIGKDCSSQSELVAALRVPTDGLVSGDLRKICIFSQVCYFFKLVSKGQALGRAIDIHTNEKLICSDHHLVRRHQRPKVDFFSSAAVQQHSANKAFAKICHSCLAVRSTSLDCVAPAKRAQVIFAVNGGRIRFVA